MKMKAVGINEFGGPEVLRVIEVEKPAPQEGQVLIKVQATSVNFADVQTRKGSFHGGGADFPVIPGLDVMGVIEEIGEGVSTLKAGDRVVAFPHTGTYAEYVTADENLAFAIPDSLSMEQAAASPLVSFTSHMLLNKVAELEAGETLLIHAAAGGIGTTVIQIAKAMGAKKVIGTVRGEAKVKQAYAAGADEVIDTDKEDFVERVKEITDGRGVDVILDSIGGEMMERGMDVLDLYGRMVVFGNASGSYGKISTGLLHSSTRSVRGFSSVTTRKNRPEWFAETAKKVIPLMADGKIDMKVTHVIDLKDAAKAHELMESGKLTGKIVLKV